MLSTTRQHAIVKFGLAILIFLALKGLLWGLANNDIQVGNKLRALPVVPVVLFLVPILEFILNAPFTQLSSRWNMLSAWKQWTIVITIPIALLAISFLGLLLLRPEA